jgi:hypothetical protein
LSFSPLHRITWAAEIPISASGARGTTQRALLLMLVRHTDRHGVCNPGQALLRERLSTSRATLVAAFQGLEADSLIERTPTHRADSTTGRLVRGVDRIRLRIAENPLPSSVSETETRAGPSVSNSADEDFSFRPLPVENQNAKKEGSEGGKEGGGARESFSEIFDALPEASRLGSSVKRMKEAWSKLASPPAADDLLAAAKAYASTGLTPQLAHYWIIDETFRAFIPSAASVWEPRLYEHQRSGAWSSAWGGQPGQDDCHCPAGLIEAKWRLAFQSWNSGKSWIESMWGPPPGASGCRMPIALMEAAAPPSEARAQEPRRVSGMPDLGYC